MLPEKIIAAIDSFVEKSRSNPCNAFEISVEEVLEEGYVKLDRGEPLANEDLMRLDKKDFWAVVGSNCHRGRYQVGSLEIYRKF